MSTIESALVEILGSPDRGTTFGARGPALVRQFDFRAVGRDYLTIYEGLRERGHRRVAAPSPP